MSEIKQLLKKNQQWSESIRKKDPDFFPRLAKQQSPSYLWIGCSDSRVPANQVVDMEPGEIFVHRNVANMVVHTDMNLLSVLQFAVEVLQVKHIIVCGHYGCGGVRAAMENKELGLIDNWLREIKDTYHENKGLFDKLEDMDEKADRLCELNVIRQVNNLCHTTIVQGAWNKGQKLSVHGWIYGLEDGLVKDLGVRTDDPESLPEIYRYALTPKEES